MKRILAFLLSFALAAGVTACGDKSSGGGAGGGGPVGSWSIDLEKAIDMGMAEAKKRLDEMPEDQRKMAEELMGGKAAREMMTKQLADLKMDLVVKADKTFTVAASEPGAKATDNMAGSWEEKDGKLAFTTKTKNGQPATGSDAKVIEGKMVGSTLVLVMAPGMELALKRK